MVFCFGIGFGQQTTLPDKMFDVGTRVGESIPPFRLQNLDGRELDFNAVKGQNGLALLFFRSADW
jgi:hypothetical protein